jgi:hypothetical protein
MRKRKRKQPSLEEELKRLASEKIKKDPRGRSRAELLASTLWNRSLAGDKDSLKMLLERLPVAIPEADEPAEPHNATVETKLDQAVNIYKALVDSGVIPVEWFAKYMIDKAEDDNPDVTKTMQ